MKLHTNQKSRSWLRLGSPFGAALLALIAMTTAGFSGRALAQTSDASTTSLSGTVTGTENNASSTNANGSSTASVAPAISGINETVTDTTANITWTTDQAANSQVSFGTTAGNYPSSLTTDTNNGNGMGTSHSVTITGLTPGTIYHFQVTSGNSNGLSTSSPDMTFTTTNTGNTGSNNNSTSSSTNSGGSTSSNNNGSTSTSNTGTNSSGSTSTVSGTLSNASTASTSPIVSAVNWTPSDTGATVTWLTEQPSDSQVAFGPITGPYTSSTTVDTNLVTNHSVTISGLTPGVPYHFQVISHNSSGTTGISADMMFTTTNTGGSTTSTSTNVTGLRNEISQLRQQIATLQQLIQSLLSRLGMGGGNNGNNGGNNNGGGTVSSSNATITPSSGTFSQGATVDFGGRNFAPEQNVQISLNGQNVGSAHSDGGGNFSTGSMTLPNTPGTYTYSFSNGNGGSVTSNVTVQ